jgi:formylglycine-generating enzyme required for sulfatase activity/serine/threonine protein kinase
MGHPSSEGWIGRTLDGRYRVESELGRGGMGTVYLAFDTRMERRVVVKVPEPRFLDDPGFRGRFEREVRSQVQLSHPHIVGVLDGGTEGDVPYVVLTYLDGGSLKDRIDAAGGRLAPAKVLAWLPDVARALDNVHEDEVVHRDVKPANILFDGKGNVFLADFGIAKALGEQDTGLTQTGTTPGTPDYMAPEAALDVGLDGRADQYALGVVVYRALAGRVPITSTNPFAVLTKKALEDPEPLARAAPGVSDEVSRVVMRALSRDRDQRYPDCARFAEAFRRAQGSSSRPPAPVEPVDPDTGSIPADPGVDDAETASMAEVRSPRSMRGLLPGTVAAGTLLLVLLLFSLFRSDDGAPGRPESAPGEGTPPRGSPGQAPESPEGAGDPRPESPPRREDPGHAPASTPGPVVYLEPPDTTVFTWASQHVVEGRLEHAPGGRVRIGSRVLLPDAGGRFRHAVTLVEEETTLEIRGVAADGTVGEPVTLRIVVDKDAPVLRIEEPVEGHLTNESRVRIRGRVEDSHPGPIRLGTREFTPEDDGTFVTDIELEGGDHVLRFRAEDAAGNLADPVVRRVTVDTTPPRLEIDPVESPTVAERVTVRGGCEPGCELELDGKAVEVNAEGRFGVAVPLAGGANAFEAVARDRAGNRTSRTIRIERRVPDPSRREGPYDSETMRRFRETVEKAAWGEPRWNGQKTLEVEHRATGLVFVLVPGGTFRMGSPVDEEGRREYEGPAHERRVGAFLLSKTECTQAAWTLGGGGTNLSHYKGDDHPIGTVSWDECVAWCGEVGLRLPSEAEWEYACRAGTTSPYSWGSTWSPARCMAENTGVNNDGVEYYRRRGLHHDATAPVGSFPPNAWGFLDMSGNVEEWCRDLLHRSYGETGRPDDGRPWIKGSSSFPRRVLRGGSWCGYASMCRSASRSAAVSGSRHGAHGFRPAASLAE